MPKSDIAHWKFVLSVLDQFEQRLTRYAARLSGDPGTAKDVVQHTFLKLCEADIPALANRIADSDSSWDESVDWIAPWLYRVCRHRVIDEMRLRNKSTTVDPIDIDQNQGADQTDASDRAECLVLIGRLFKELPSGEREVVELWSQGFRNREIAEITQRSEGAVRVSLHRALKQLRKHPSVQRWIQSETCIN